MLALACALIAPADKESLRVVVTDWSKNSLPAGWSIANLDNACDNGGWKGIKCDANGQITSIIFEAEKYQEKYVFSAGLTAFTALKVRLEQFRSIVSDP